MWCAFDLSVEGVQGLQILQFLVVVSLELVVTVYFTIDPQVQGIDERSFQSEVL